MILVYYHLLTTDVGCDPAELDAAIERWLAEKGAPAVDFDMAMVLQNMQAVHATLATKASSQPRETALLEIDDDGDCRVLCLLDAKRLLDQLWDEAFDYNGDYAYA